MVAYHSIGETTEHGSREGSEAGMDRRYAKILYAWDSMDDAYLPKHIGGARADLRKMEVLQGKPRGSAVI
jgi:hypothetical protein